MAIFKILTVVGARPQFIKAAVVSKNFRDNDEIREVLVHTGQHYDPNMSDVFFRELDMLPPDHNLGIGSGSHGAQTGRMIEGIESLLLSERPDCVLIYGDTNSTLAAALAAVKLHIPIAHVEAGLRSFNRRMPEEINRILSDHASDLLFAPTDAAVRNLRGEGILDSRISLVGDVMLDIALSFGERADRESQMLSRLGIQSRGYILATVHRAENTDDHARLGAILEGLAEVAREIPVILPLHPRLRGILAKDPGLQAAASALRVVDPVGYLDMVMLEKQAKLIATDSGGVQKEAFFHRVPCVTLRDETEWVELVALGWNRLVIPGSARAVSDGIQEGLHAQPGQDASPYGDGQAGMRIADQVANRMRVGF